jgi:3-oxoacyl-[acyl-carrier protein] reductase
MLIMSFKDKVVLVTGGTRGIGKAIVEEFAGAGATVIFTYAKSDELAAQITRDLKAQGHNAVGFKVDVSDYEAVQKFKEDVLDNYQRVDILVNNAGIIKDKALMMMSLEEWRQVIDTNLNGTFNVTKAFLVNFLKQKSGAIINISSVSGIEGLPRQSNYASSKGGINSFTKSLAREVGQYGIRVNAVAPGFIKTDMVDGLNQDYLKSMTDQIPLGRLGKPEEVAKITAFLASDKAAYITGQIVRIDGGM